MKILVDIADKQAEFGMEVLCSLTFIKKAQSLSKAKTQLIKEIRQSVEKINLVRSGELKARPIEDLLDEL